MLEIKRILKLCITLLLMAALVAAFMYREHFSAQALEAFIDKSGVWAPLVFILIYIVATVLFIPGAAITLLGGVLFGPWLGTLYNLMGATIGAAVAFLISRYLASDWVAAKAAGRAKSLIDGVEQEGWRFIAFVRLVPLFPFNLLNYMLGLTRINFWLYLMASFVFMVPGGFAYTYLGYAGKEALTGGDDLIQKALLALGLLAAVSFLPGFVKRLRR